MERGGHVYILGSTTGTLYLGVTSNLYQRIIQHRAGLRSGFAHQHACTRLLYAEPFASIDEAITREKQLKGWTRAKKLNLIQKLNADYKDMAQLWGWQLIHRDQQMRPPPKGPSS